MVLDASTLVSAALKENSLPERALLRAVGGRDWLTISQEVADEYREVLSRSKFDRFVAAERRQRILDLVLVAAETVQPIESIEECRDPKDDRYLALAAGGKADVVVTGDEHHLLPMHPWRGVSILSAAEYLAL